MPNYSPDYETLAIEQMQDPQACLRIALQDPCGDPRRALETIIEVIDRKLSTQLNQILHHTEFQQLEGAWRGLYFLVNSIEINNSIKIKALNISKKELHKNLKVFKGPARERGPLFLKIFHESYSVIGGESFSCLIGDYYLDHSPQDVEMLAELSKICAISHTPFFGGAAASLVNFESWQDFVKQFSLNESLYEKLWKSLLFNGRQYDAWHRLREIEETRYLNLVMPRCLARLPYGFEEKPNREYMFREKIQKSTINHKQYVWINAAYAHILAHKSINSNKINHSFSLKLC